MKIIKSNDLSYETKNAVFALKNDVDISGYEAGGQHGHADAQISVHAVLELESSTTSDLISNKV
jgi:hypothetical protein